ncbi:hypothetical protein [Nocardia mexicana]|uniref:ABC-2 family transporter n=1 Tax=Nocardia mexicana TaxID=279262 RepID=A0A370H8Q3_9NOCA|nr:hypothetical protein [Nocardia mexicana]RDI52899.1 hypothetical protein DFR68_103286 [Nocardia mexicana]
MTVVQRAVAVAIAAVVLQGVMLIAFAWPASNVEPRDLPVVVVGPQADGVVAQLSRRAPGAFEVTVVADAERARGLIADREAYGAIVTGAGERTQVLVASAASPAVAQQLTRIAGQLSGVPEVAVEDVVAGDPDDPNGGGFAAMVLPLVVPSLAAGYLLALAVPSVGARMVGLAVYAFGAGLSSAAVVRGWLSLVPGSYLALAAVIGLISVAVSATIVACGAVAGRIGLGVAGLTFLLLGNPLSGASTGPEMLPRPWGGVGQLLPPGAGASLLRSVMFFDGAGAGALFTVLLVWAATALTMLTLLALADTTRHPQQAEHAFSKIG